MSEQLGITAKKEENFSEWYQEVIQKSDLMDYSEVSGCMIFRPFSYSIWEKIKSEIDKRFKKIGIQNAYFPLFIPEKLLEKEAEHFQGFTPEVAWVTHTGTSKLEERLAIRPTSEAIIYPAISKWIRSWRDLPLKLNLWNNVVRWEFKHPTPFLRTREFLWCEGHNAYGSKEEALKDRDKVLEAFEVVQEEFMALPGIKGRKTQKEKFAGAVDSYSIEHLFPDGKAVQGPDYHYDGEKFSKAYGITFKNKNDEEKYVKQTTYAITTRQIGVMLAVHGDNKGLVVPPKISPIKAVIIPIYKEEQKEMVKEYSKKVCSKLEDFNPKLDDRDEYTPGWKFNEWELKGIPLRIEIGPKEVKEEKVTLVRRDTGEKIEERLSKIEEKVGGLLGKIQSNLFKSAKKFLQENRRETEDYDELRKIIKEKGGFVKAPWCGNTSCEREIKDETSAKITNIPFEYETPKGKKCIKCGKEAEYWVNFAKSY